MNPPGELRAAAFGAAAPFPRLNFCSSADFVRSAPQKFSNAVESLSEPSGPQRVARSRSQPAVPSATTPSTSDQHPHTRPPQRRFDGICLAELNEEFGVSRSHVRGDLLALKEAGTRLEMAQEQGRYGHGRVRLLDADTTAIPVTRSERYTLLAARGFFDIFRGSQLHDDMESIFGKVLQTMPAKTRKDTRSLHSKIFFRPSGGTKSYENHKDIIDALLTGLLMERLVSYTHRQRSGRKSTGVMAPYAMVIHRNGLYLVAQRKHDAEANEIEQEPRVFAIERFLEADWLRGTSFEYPADFRVVDHFDGAFGLISGSQTHHDVVNLDKTVRAEAETRICTTPKPTPRCPTEASASNSTSPASARSSRGSSDGEMRRTLSILQPFELALGLLRLC